MIRNHEEVVAWIDKQKAWGDVDRRDPEDSKIGWKGAHPKCKHKNKDVQKGLHDGKSSHPFLKNHCDWVPLYMHVACSH